MRIEEKVAKSLIHAGKTLSVAESCTGGMLSDRLTNVPGSSNFLKTAVIAYSNEAKTKLLKVPQAAIRQHGAVSTQVAVAMAQGVRKLFATDFGVGITGIAGPSGGTRPKPVGLTFIAVSTGVETLCLECRFRGSRRNIKTQASTQALRLLYEFLT